MYFADFEIYMVGSFFDHSLRLIYLHLSEPFHAYMSAASRVICVALTRI